MCGRNTLGISIVHGRSLILLHSHCLVFHRYGDTYFLSEVVTAGEDTARELTPSRSERQLQRELASNKAEPDTVALAVN